jgi:hypothetical protein
MHAREKQAGEGPFRPIIACVHDARGLAGQGACRSVWMGVKRTITLTASVPGVS